MILTRWHRPNPFRRVANFRDEVDNLFNLAFSHVNANNSGQEAFQGWFPAVDVFEHNDNLVVKAELPGLKKEDIEISVQDGQLFLTGERKAEKRASESEAHRTERWSGKFQRAVTLPYRVATDKISATYTEGVLTVTLPKAEEAKPKKIEVTFKQ